MSLKDTPKNHYQSKKTKQSTKYKDLAFMMHLAEHMNQRHQEMQFFRSQPL